MTNRPLTAALLTLAIAMSACSRDGPGPAEPAEGASQEVAIPAAGPGAIWAPWQPNPIPLDAGILQAIDRECRGSMAPFPAVRLVVADARGDGVVQAQFAGPAGEAFCMDMTIDRTTGRVAAVGGGSVGTGTSAVQLGPQAIESHSGMGTGGPGDAIVRQTTSGRVGNGVAAVVIQMPGKPPIRASLANGWYLAWWPGPWPRGTKVLALDAVGGKVAEAEP